MCIAERMIQQKIVKEMHGQLWTKKKKTALLYKTYTTHTIKCIYHTHAHTQRHTPWRSSLTVSAANETSFSLTISVAHSKIPLSLLASPPFLWWGFTKSHPVFPSPIYATGKCICQKHTLSREHHMYLCSHLHLCQLDYVFVLVVFIQKKKTLPSHHQALLSYYKTIHFKDLVLSTFFCTIWSSYYFTSPCVHSLEPRSGNWGSGIWFGKMRAIKKKKTQGWMERCDIR